MSVADIATSASAIIASIASPVEGVGVGSGVVAAAVVATAVVGVAVVGVAVVGVSVVGVSVVGVSVVGVAVVTTVVVVTTISSHFAVTVVSAVNTFVAKSTFSFPIYQPRKL